MASRARVLNETTKIRALISPKLVPQPSATNAKHQVSEYRQDHHNDEIPTEAIESDLEEYIYDPGDAETDEEFTSDDVGLNRINQTPSIHLFVIRRVPS